MHHLQMRLAEQRRPVQLPRRTKRTCIKNKSVEGCTQLALKIFSMRRSLLPWNPSTTLQLLSNEPTPAHQTGQSLTPRTLERGDHNTKALFCLSRSHVLSVVTPVRWAGAPCNTTGAYLQFGAVGGPDEKDGTKTKSPKKDCLWHGRYSNRSHRIGRTAPEVCRTMPRSGANLRCKSVPSQR